MAYLNARLRRMDPNKSGRKKIEAAEIWFLRRMKIDRA